jgi:hypothetical protein
VVTARARSLVALGLLALAVALFFAFANEGTTASPVPTSSAETPRTATATRSAPRTRDGSPDRSNAPLDDAAAAAARSKWPIRVTTNVPGASVQMQVRRSGSDPDPPPETKTADASGFVGFDAPPSDVPVAKFELVARAAGHETTLVCLSAPGDCTIELPSGVAVRGFVRDADGAPVADADVQGRRTGADGSFEAFFDHAGPVQLRVGHGALLSRVVDVEAPKDGVIVVLDRGLRVSGRVAFPDGRPLPNVRILNETEGTCATTDDDGRYTASGFAPGPVIVWCKPADDRRTVEAGATGVDFVVQRSVLRIRYLDVRGRPFRFAATLLREMKDGVVVDVSAGEGPADGVDDTYCLAPGTTVSVSATGPTGQTGSGSVTLDDPPRLQTVDVVIGTAKPTGTIRLVVRDESPVFPKSVYVEVQDEAGSAVAGGSRDRLDLDSAGAAEIPNVPAGHVTVVVAAAAHWSTESLDTLLVTARPTATVEVGRTTEVAATLVLGGRIRATVRDEDGKPVTSDVVRLSTVSNGRAVDMFVHRNPDGGWTTELDASPSVLLDAVVPGRYVVQTTGPAGDEVKKEVDVVRGETADVELVVPVKR